MRTTYIITGIIAWPFALVYLTVGFAAFLLTDLESLGEGIWNWACNR